MKLPTPRKLPSGSWYARITVDGKMVNITRPTKKEVEQELMALKSKAKEAPTAANLTVAQAVDAYIAARESSEESKTHVYSPATIRGYKTIRENRFKTIMDRKIASITPQQWQQIINAESNIVSAKTVYNAWGLIGSAIEEATGKKIEVKLPQRIEPDARFVSSSDLKKFLAQIKGQKYEIPILLALHSLRRSELMNIRWENIDLQANTINVQGAMVPDSTNKLVRKKENKNSTSRRTIPFILPQLQEAVKAADKKSEYVVTCHPNTILTAVKKNCLAAGIPECDIHGLRKSFASMMLVDLKMPDDIVMQIGGWSTPQTMHKIYSQVSKENARNAGKQLSDFIQKL